HEPARPCALRCGAELLQERLERCERGELELVVALASVYLVAHEASLSEHAQVPTHRRSTDIERTGEPARGHRAIAQHPQDVPANRVGECLSDGVHDLPVTNSLLFCQHISPIRAFCAVCRPTEGRDNTWIRTSHRGI